MLRLGGIFELLILSVFHVSCITTVGVYSDGRIKSLFLLRLLIFLVASFVNFRKIFAWLYYPSCSQAFKFNFMSSINIFSNKKLYFKIVSKRKTRLFFNINALYESILISYVSDYQLFSSS